MGLTRRDFLKGSGAAAGGALLMLKPGGLAAESPAFPLHKRVGEIPTVCTFCAVGCGQLVAVQDGRVVNVEGDPDNPINRGRLCSKGLATRQLVSREERRQFSAEEPRGFDAQRLGTPAGRLDRVLYRAPGSAEWEAKPWDWALDEIAKRVKRTRDAHWISRNAAGQTVNRTEAIACLGGSQNTNEECYLLAKAMRSLGLVYLEHQART